MAAAFRYPMEQVFLARHGETEWNRIRRRQGQLNSPLTRGALAHPSVRSREAVLPPGQIVGGHFPSTYVASESPGQGGMETQMNVRSASPVFRY